MMLTEKIAIMYRNFRGESDYQNMVNIINGSKDADGLEWATSVEDTANNYAHLHNCDPYTDVIFAEVEGQAVGYGRCTWDEQLDGIRTYFFFAHMLPQWRNQGIRATLLRKMEARIKAIAANHPPEVEEFFQAWASDTEIHWQQLLEAEGYTAVRYSFEMVRSNLDNIPDCPLPEGIEVRFGQLDKWRQIWEAAREAFRDHWGEAEWNEEEFAGWSKDKTFNPALWQVAWDGDEVAGGVLNFINEAENEEYGRKRGYTETIFVRKPWRGQRLAQALIARSFNVLKQAGMTEAALGVDAENPTGALHLYRKMGFKETKRSMTYRKLLRAD